MEATCSGWRHMQEYPAAKGHGKVHNASQANFINDQDDIVLVYFVDIRVVRIEDGRLRFFSQKQWIPGPSFLEVGRVWDY